MAGYGIQQPKQQEPKQQQPKVSLSPTTPTTTPSKAPRKQSAWAKVPTKTTPQPPTTAQPPPKKTKAPKASTPAAAAAPTPQDKVREAAKQLPPEQQAMVESFLGAGSDRKAIGVPSDYKAGTFDIGGNTGDVDRGYKEVAPRYWEGDQFNSFSGRDPQTNLKLQLDMKAAGVFPKTYKPTGVWDDVSQTGMEKLMTFANQSGRTWEEVMGDYKANVPDQEVTGYTLQLKSPDDIKALLQSTSGKVIGRSLTPAEADQLVRGYQDIDRSAQEAEAAAKASAAAGGQAVPYTTPQSVDTYGTNQLRQQFKGEADWVTANQRMKEFYSILGEGGGMNRG